MNEIEKHSAWLPITQKLSATNEQAVISQISKDFSLCGITNAIPSSSIIAAINTVNIIITELLMTDNERVRALLYRIDIKEENIVDLYNESTSTKDLATRITMLIVHRELLKVSNRDSFK